MKGYTKIQKATIITFALLGCGFAIGSILILTYGNVKIPELPMWIIGCLEGATFVDSIDNAIKHYKLLKGEL